MKWFLKCLKHYADFKGRARRKEYWFFILFYFLLYMVCFILDFALFFDVSQLEGMSDPSMGPEEMEAFVNQATWLGVWPKYMIITAFFTLVLLVPSWAVCVRRLHDIGRSGWWVVGYLGLNLLFVVLSSVMSNVLINSLVLLAQIAMSIWMLVWLFTDSEYEENAYGPCPKSEGVQEVLE